MPSSTTTSKTLPSATWRRRNGDLSVVRIDLSVNAWIGTNGHHWRMLIGNSKALKDLAQALCIGAEPGRILWLTAGKTPPPSLTIVNEPQHGSWLVTRSDSHVDLKSWRNVRNKLDFRPRRWPVPSVSVLEARPGWDRPYRMHDGEGHWSDDGATVLLTLDAKGLDHLAQACWNAHDDRRELIDYDLGWCFKDQDRCVRVLYSSFRERFQYAWESDSDRVRRMSGTD